MENLWKQLRRLLVALLLLSLSACPGSEEDDDSDLLFALPLLLIDTRTAVEVTTAEAEAQLGTIVGSCTTATSTCGDYGTGFTSSTAAQDCALFSGTTYNDGTPCTATGRTGTCVLIGSGFANGNVPGGRTAFRTYDGFTTISARISCTEDRLRKSSATAGFFAAN